MFKAYIIDVRICPESAFDLTLDEAEGASNCAVLSQIEMEGQAIHLQTPFASIGHARVRIGCLRVSIECSAPAKSTDNPITAPSPHL
jgi:hypothetical protein